MEAFRVRIEIGDPQGQQFTPLEALVDTGATYTWVPRSLLEGLGVTPQEDRDFILADGRRVAYGMAWVLARINGHINPTLVVFGDEGTEPLLGVVTLEEFGLGVDAGNQRLIPTPGLLKRVRIWTVGRAQNISGALELVQEESDTIERVQCTAGKDGVR